MTVYGMWFRIFGVFVGTLLTAFPSTGQPSGGATIQTLTFAPVPTVAIGVLPITLTATASSGLTMFTFSTSSDSGICTVSANKVTIAGVGVCALTASQAGNASYAPTSANASIDVVAIQSPVTLIAVQSRKMHGAFGPFDIHIESSIPLAGAVSIEPRVGNAGHDIVFQFSGPVNLIGSASAFGTPASLVGATPTILGSEVSIVLTGVPDNHRVTTCLSGVNGTLTQTASIGFLVGDVNRSGSANVSDIVGVKAHDTPAIDETNFMFDLNADGAISASDLSMVKSRSGQQLPIVPVVNPLPRQIVGAPPAVGSVNTPYRFMFGVSGTAPITWSVVSGLLPAGLNLDPSTGVLSGTPITAGTYTFAIQAANCTLPNVVSGIFTVTIMPMVNWETLLSIEGMPIPVPSKLAVVFGAMHPGLNGAGAAINAWAVNPTRCNNTQPPIIHSWHHNIDFSDYAGKKGVDFFEMAPNEALTYQFVATTSGVGSVDIGTSTQVPLVSTFMSLSTTPCDFDNTKLVQGPTRSYCYASQPQDNSLAYEVTNSPGPLFGTCKLLPGQTYYLNVRFQDGTPAGANTSDSCAPRGVARCGGYLQIK